MNGSFIRYKKLGSRLFRFVTMHAFDRQTDRWTETERWKQQERALHSQLHGKNMAKFSKMLQDDDNKSSHPI